MFVVLRRLVAVSLFLAMNSVVIGCAQLNALYSPSQKVDPAHLYSSDGFQFRFPFAGEWYVADSRPGYYSVGQKPLENKSSTLAAAAFGPLGTPGGKPMSARELIDAFKLRVEAEAKGGRMSEVKTRFAERVFKKPHCLMFYQTGIDNSQAGKMNLSNDGMICLHPSRPYQFIWLALSERVPDGMKLSDLSHEEKAFFESLDFN